MPRFTSATCPRCGAQLQPEPGNERATCSYCGTTSFVQPGARPTPVGLQPRQPRAALMLTLLVGAALLVVSAALAIYLTRAVTALPVAALPVVSPRQLSTPARVASASVLGDSVTKPTTVRVLSDFTPLLAQADADADGKGDLVVLLASTAAGGVTTRHYAVFSGATGLELARTPPLADDDVALAAAVRRRLLTASRTGQLTSFGFDGTAQWTTALGARVIAFCSARDPSTLLVATDDERRVAIDLTTGRQNESKEPCDHVLARSQRGHDPRDRHDYGAPPGIESYHCGGVTVMGSANYTVPDACQSRAHVDTDHWDRLIGHRLWRLGEGWLVFGVRKPGAYVPMVGLVSHGRLLWKVEVPLDNPLEAREGSPQRVGLSANSVIAAYEASKGNQATLTAFATSDGTRKWTTPLPAPGNVTALVSSRERVFVAAGEVLYFIDASNGQVLRSVGSAR